MSMHADRHQIIHTSHSHVQPTHTYTHTHIHIHMHTYTTHIHIHIHTYSTHTHTHVMDQIRDARADGYQIIHTSHSHTQHTN